MKSRPSTSAPAGVRPAYEETIEQVVLADELGYRTAWFVKHHCLPGHCFCPRPASHVWDRSDQLRRRYVRASVLPRICKQAAGACRRQGEVKMTRTFIAKCFEIVASALVLSLVFICTARAG